ncbi:NAD+ synthase (glutamine-hydrolysing) [Fulvimarina manganoxydans]|uniref:Glutamine-dependent NAD(+) synthetase n=1 Tax=Fulvimarina manganoxydans TaxID=937218 RepID=A0A1W1ZS70_9HYPH|nr:NAD(+) synthase [Fulvimarina manganoxydans]SMC51173.1 NAD+ synthase (glutamine-hydrolysing) [Fulvimarina manganoxydans]
MTAQPPVPDSFFSIHRHGFARIAVATPSARNGDPAGNGRAIEAQAREASQRDVDVVVFPELSLTGYANDDLHLQEATLLATLAGIESIRAASEDLKPVLLIGAALSRNGRLYNCAVAIHRGRILGVVPKIYLPNYREYYEKRWFASGDGTDGLTIEIGGETVPFGPDLLFAASDRPGFVVHIEICEDYWAPFPPSIDGALAGATVLCNLSASNITIGKSHDRHLLSASQSMRCLGVYAYSAAGHGESTTDLAWDGQGEIYELGDLLAESERFSRGGELLIADVDCNRVLQERMRMPTFNDAAARRGHPETRFRRIAFEQGLASGDIGFHRPIRRFPFVPNTPERLDQDCYEAFNIQVDALVTRFEATPGDTMVIGISGGLDSTHALIVAAKACDRMGVSRKNILGFTMPGFATGDATKSNAWKLMEAMGISAAEIDIRPAARQMLSDMGHPFADGEPVYDITFENVQAGLRTDYLFRLANQRNGFVIGTGDLSELALGWCTYGVGDQMSHYAVNSGVPKTLIQYLIRWCVTSGQFDETTDAVLTAILDTEISPELVPADAQGGLQSTEEKIGPYELNDFFLFHILRYGFAPSKVAFLAHQAWRDKTTGRWPIGFPDAKKREYDLDTITFWLEKFLFRFFQTSQFKRSAIPNGPKVSAGGSLSPRGDWRAPSDSSAAAWIKELRAAMGRG